MSYRVETASSGRAVCQSTECKKHQIKIDKDELRFGVWVDFQDRGSWRWRHWGCVSGKQLQNVRELLEDPRKPGTYRWDALDGYEGTEKNSLDKHPDLQDKVRRVIEQGFIDKEDWNGDPEMNKLGETGMYTATSKKQMREDEKARAHEFAELQEKLATITAERDVLVEAGKSTKKLDAKVEKLKEVIDANPESKKKPTAAKGKKRGKNDDEDGEGDGEPVKKKRATKAKAKKEDDGDDEDEDEDVKAAPVKKPRGKKAVKKEEEDAEMGGLDEDVKPAPVKKPRGKKAVKKEDSDTEEEVMPAKSSRAKKTAVKKEEEGIKPAPPKKSRAKKVKNEEEDQGEVKPAAPAKKPCGKKAVKAEPEAEADGGLDEAVDVKPLAVKKGGRGKKAAVVKDEVENEDEEGASQDTRMANAGSSVGGGVEEEDGEKKEIEVTKGKGKKSATPAAAKSGRGSRSRAASKTTNA